MSPETKICFISMNAYPLFDGRIKNVFGGSEVEFYLLASELSEDSDFDVHFVVKRQELPVCKKFGKVSMHSYGKCFSSLKGKSFLKILPWIADKLVFPHVIAFFVFLNKLDCDVYVQSCAGRLTGLVAMFCRISGRKFIYKVASDIDCDGTYEKRAGIDGKIYKYGIANATHVITISEKQRKLLKAQGIKSSLILCSLPPVKFEKAENKRTVLWVGRCVESKHPELFLRLASELKEYFFEMVCVENSGSEELFGEISAKAKTVDNLTFNKGVPFGEMQTFYGKARLFVSTSDYEGFPLSFIQSMQNGVPVISLNVDPDKVLTEKATGRCSGSYDNLKKDITELMENKDKWEHLSANAFAYADEFHNLEKAVDKIKKLIDEIVNE